MCLNLVWLMNFLYFLGQDAAKVLYLKSKETVKFTNYELEEMIKDYSNRLNSIT